MQEDHIILAIVAVIAIVLISLFVVVANLQKTVVIRVKDSTPKEVEEARRVAIEELIELVAKRTTSKNDLTAAILKASKECPFPKKIKGIAPKSAKTYLNFVLLIASHRNADAKLIAFMDEELKKANPEYKTEIDIYESEGINQRGNRI
jgi:type II secretory pathway pseudopilin PulG